MCGECIAASNLALLDALGVGAEVDARAGAELRRVALMRGRRDDRRARCRAAEAPARAGAARSAASTSTRSLADAAEAAGATRLQPWSLQVDRRRAPAAFVLQRATGAGRRRRRRCRAARRLVVAAHGSWEPLPSERAERREARAPCDLFAFKANFRGAAIAADLLPVLSFAGGYGGMVVADDGIATLAGCIRDDRLQALARGAARRARRRRRSRRCCGANARGVAAALAGATREGAVARERAASARRSPRRRRGEGDDGVFRIGNAAGEAHPIVGEGISMALQSAFVLADADRRRSAPSCVGRGQRARGATARARRLRSALAAPLHAPPARRRRVRPRRDAAGARRRGVAAGRGAGRAS